MNKEDVFDVAIIGAGAVGCAIGRELTLRYPGKKIAIVERMINVGLETTSRNSGVLHSGLHQNPKFLKSRLAREGSRMAAEYHLERGLPILHCGMIVAVSTSAIREGLWRDWKSLAHLISRGREQGVKFKFLTPWTAKKMEPELKLAGGIFIPDVWVIDPLTFTQNLRRDAEKNGAKFFCESDVVEIRADSGFYRIFVGGPNVSHRYLSARVLVNSAGLYADDIASLAGVPGYRIYPWRGEYYEIVGPKAGLVKHLIYPAMPPGSASKGIHFGPRVDGRLFLGPNAKPVTHKNCYHDDKTPVEEFLGLARRFLPGLKADDLAWAYSGIRPKLSATAEEDDFIIRLDRTSPPLLNLVGIESPGLASSMAIGRYAVDILAPYLS